MAKFGEYLLAQGAIEPDQFEEALRSHAVYGGRIGTNLIELGFVSLDEMAEHLSAFHGVPVPPVDWLEQPDPRALKLVPISLVRRYQLLPIKLEDDGIHVAMLDARNQEQLDFVEAAAGRPVVPYVLPEVRLLYWLEIHCGMDRHPRYVNLAARGQSGFEQQDADSSFYAPVTFDEDGADEVEVEVEKSDESGRTDATGETDRAELGLEALPPGSSLAPDPADTELLLEDLVVLDVPTPEVRTGSTRAAASPGPAEQPRPSPPAPSSNTAAAVPAPAGPAEIASLEAQLQGASDRDTAIELSLRIARAYARSSAIFVVRDGMVAGYRSQTDGQERAIDEVMLPVDTASIFATPAASGTAFRGRPPHDGIDGRLLELLGRPDALEVLIHPISIRARVVNLLYADNGADALADTAVAALTELGHTLARTYERMILEAKQASVAG